MGKGGRCKGGVDEGHIEFFNPLTDSIGMKSKDVKKILIEKFNRRVRTRTIPGSDIIEAWIPWDTRSAITEFPLALRVAALKLEYGDVDWLAKTNGVAGNVGLHGITLRATTWEKVLA